MEIGERFRPYKKFNGIFIPESISILPISSLSQGAKLVYGRLARYGGEDGEIFPSREKLAGEVGCKTRQVDNYLKELTSFGLIEIVRTGLNRTNRYHFLWHQVLEPSLTKSAKLLHTESSNNTEEETQEGATPSIKESQDKRIIDEETARMNLVISFIGKEFSNKVAYLFECYRDWVNSDAVLTRSGAEAILTLFTEYGSETPLLQAMHYFSESSWWMEKHGKQPVTWFFKDAERIQKFRDIANWNNKK